MALLAGALIASLTATVSWGQINTGKITGTSLDSTGSAVAGVEIRATNADTGVTTSTHSFGNGEYLLNFLSPGTYQIEGEKAGFQRVTQTGVVVNAGGITRINFDLVVGEVRQTVEVAAHVLAVTTETSELSKTFTQKDLDRLPNIDRNPLYQLNLMPGANNDLVYRALERDPGNRYGSAGKFAWDLEHPDQVRATGRAERRDWTRIFRALRFS
jgi:hypothetical protein